MDKNDKKLLRNTLLIFGIVVILLVVVIFANKIMTANVIKYQGDYEDWLKDNCNCVDKEKKVASPLLECSKYNCSGKINIWNNKTKMWEDE